MRAVSRNCTQNITAKRATTLTLVRTHIATLSSQPCNHHGHYTRFNILLHHQRRAFSTTSIAMSADCPKSMLTSDDPNHLEAALPHHVRRMHDDAVTAGATTYTDPDSGYMVFCRKAHIDRGKCCGSGCRHCPYGWANVPKHRMPKPKPPVEGVYDPTGATSTSAASASAATSTLPDVEEVVVCRTLSADAAAVADAAGAPSASTAASSDAPKKSRVYTRTGDKGKSSLFTGERRAKTDIIFETLGTVDELASCIGVAKEFLRLQQATGDRSINVATGPKAAATASSEEGTITDEQVRQIISVEALEHIQQLLMDIGTIVATPTLSDRATERAKEKVSAYAPLEWVVELERQIDLADSFLPPITVFILPGGGLASAHLHLARSTCRRAERCMLAVQEEQGDDYCDLLPAACKFVNRLSDFLFVAARAVALHADVHRSAPNGGR